jgi:hypothetical protein
MNERERLTAVFDNRPCEALPWYADLSYLYAGMQVRGTLSKRFEGAEGYLEFHRELGAGICFYAPMLWTQQYTYGVTEQTRVQGDVSVTTIQTPMGEARQAQQYMPEAYTWGVTEHFVKGIRDLRVMRYAWEHRTVEPNYRQFEETDRLWGPSGCAVGLAPITSSLLQMLLTRWAGVTATMELYMDHREELDEIIASIQEADDPIFDILCESPCRLIEFPENLSAEITGRRLFEQYNAPYYKRRIDALHKAGKKVSIHNDGTLRGTFDLLGKCGFDAVEAVTPAPVGDIPLDRLRAEAGPGIIIWGGLPGVLFSPCYTEEQFERHLQKAISVLRTDGRCVLGVADQVPPDGLISRVKRVREAIGS